MKLKHLISKHADRLTAQYGKQLLPGHRKALDAILACRSQCGECYSHCENCHLHQCFPLSCGHRSCPQCQHHLAEDWQARQEKKHLPVNYFMVTFTIPQQLKNIAWRYQTIVYDCLFKASIETLQTLGKNNFALAFGMTAVLHTHKRDKGYHPHIHIVLPSGGLKLDETEPTWQSLPQNFIVNEFALAKIFRGILLRMLMEQSIDIPTGMPKQWVSQIKRVGFGNNATKYLSRYLYRGVISENDILTDKDGQVTFRYQESKTKKMVTQKQSAEDFLWRLLKHVLPRGFRRVRDYGFLHGNAHKKLACIQSALKVKLKKAVIKKKRACCPNCDTPMTIDAVLAERIPMRFRFYPKLKGLTTPATA